ncbi:MAG: glutamate 5-kinase [Coriobacteriales bacterium]|nr:glutamate 5-kinase [Coriobacteriales bacterium]
MALYGNRIVVKVGTSTLMNESGKSDLRAIERLVRVLADVHNQGYDVILVSSGAITMGVTKLGLKAQPGNLRMKQAVSAVGQCSMIHLYDRFFADYGQTIAQILLGAEDIEQGDKRANLTSTFDTLLNLGVIPVVNENDPVVSREIEGEGSVYGDNDLLSAAVAELCCARLLLILSDIDGFYDQDPLVNSDARPIERIESIDAGLEARLVAVRGSRRGSDGIRTKLAAAQRATAKGIDVVIVNGKTPDAIYGAIQGEEVGTRFPGKRGRD